MISVRELLEISVLKEVTNSGPAAKENLNFHMNDGEGPAAPKSTNDGGTGTPATNAGPEAAKKGPGVAENLKFRKFFKNEKASKSASAASEVTDGVPKKEQKGEVGK